VKSRRSIVVVEGLYREPHSVRNYALAQSYYTPYEDHTEIQSNLRRASWWATRFRQFDECPFKSSQGLIAALEQAVGEKIDMGHWKASFPVDLQSKPLRDPGKERCSCLWNCCFHVKPENGQQPGQGVHNHVTDDWNSVGPDGWAGILYLNSDAPLEGGLHLWRNVDRKKEYDWMTPPENWECLDSFGNHFNRLILVRGDIPHSGAAGWGDRLETGRMFQTFFFKTVPLQTFWPVSLLGVSTQNVSIN